MPQRSKAGSAVVTTKLAACQECQEGSVEWNSVIAKAKRYGSHSGLEKKKVMQVLVRGSYSRYVPKLAKVQSQLSPPAASERKERGAD